MSDAQHGTPSEGAPVEPDDPGAVGLVDWHRTGRRIRTSVLVVGGLAVAGWLVSGALGDGITGRGLAGWIGLACGVLFLVELVVVGGAALRGMLRAGERGERLASDGVGLFPARMPSRHPLRGGEDPDDDAGPDAADAERG